MQCRKCTFFLVNKICLVLLQELRGQQTYSVKVENILGFAGHAISVVTTQLCSFRMKAALGNSSDQLTAVTQPVFQQIPT